jgi:hypothetical protein
MSWHYEPPAPETEAEVTLSKYHLQLRAAEARNSVEVDVGTEPSAGSRAKRLRNAVVGMLMKVARVGQKSDRDPAP